MNVSDFRDFCLSLPEVEEKMPFRKFNAAGNILAFYVGGHIFCYYDIEKFEMCTMKCPPEQMAGLKEEYMSVVEPYNMSHRYWIGVQFNGDVPDAVLMRLVRQSYEIVRGRR